MPIKRVAGADEGALVLVDATSGAGGLPVDIAETDVYYFAPQKSFASDGGLWIGVFSPAALERAARIHASGRHVPEFFSLPTAIDNSRRTRRTTPRRSPPSSCSTTSWSGSTARAAWTGRSRRTADLLAHACTAGPRTSKYATPFVTDPAKRSQVIGTIDFTDEIDAAAVAKVLRANGIVDTEPVPQAGPQPAARRDVPGRRPGGRRGADGLRRLRHRAAVIAADADAGPRDDRPGPLPSATAARAAEPAASAPANRRPARRAATGDAPA